jgi:hypothetical protein
MRATSILSGTARTPLIRFVGKRSVPRSRWERRGGREESGRWTLEDEVSLLGRELELGNGKNHVSLVRDFSHSRAPIPDLKD